MRNRDIKRLNESADESLLAPGSSTEYIDDTVASQIALNLKGESDAIEGYEKLIPWFKSVGDPEAVATIQEIISDEKNHIMLLNELLLKYDNVKANKE